MDNNFQVIEKDAIDSPVQDINWTGSSVGTDEVPLIDNGSGKKLFLRQFSFKVPKGEHLPDEELLDYNKSKILAFLWKDELVYAGIMKVVWKDDENFLIFALAEAKSGSAILEDALMLQQVHG
jgi:hypothetical protein